MPYFSFILANAKIFWGHHSVNMILVTSVILQLSSFFKVIYQKADIIIPMFFIGFELYSNIERASFSVAHSCSSDKESPSFKEQSISV